MYKHIYMYTCTYIPYIHKVNAYIYYVYTYIAMYAHMYVRSYIEKHTQFGDTKRVRESFSGLIMVRGHPHSTTACIAKVYSELRRLDEWHQSRECESVSVEWAWEERTNWSKKGAIMVDPTGNNIRDDSFKGGEQELQLWRYLSIRYSFGLEEADGLKANYKKF